MELKKIVILCQYQLYMKPTNLDTLSFNNVECTKFLFFTYFVCWDLKEKYHIRRNINCKRNKSLSEMSIIIIILICQKLGPVGPVQEKIKLLSPNTKVKIRLIMFLNFRN